MIPTVSGSKARHRLSRRRYEGADNNDAKAVAGKVTGLGIKTAYVTSVQNVTYVF